MIYTPKPNRTIAISVTLFFIISSLVFIGFSLVSDSFMSGILKATALIFVMTAILITERYLLVNYTYTADSFEFTVTKNTQKTKQTVCRLYYTELTDIKPYKISKKETKGKKCYNYCITMFTKNAYCLFYDSNEESGVIMLECSSSFAKTLEKHIKIDINLK